MRTKIGVPISKVLGCAEQNRMPTWPQQIRNELDGDLHVTERQTVVRRVLGFSQSRSTVRGVRDDRLDSSVKSHALA